MAVRTPVHYFHFTGPTEAGRKMSAAYSETATASGFGMDQRTSRYKIPMLVLERDQPHKVMVRKCTATLATSSFPTVFSSTVRQASCLADASVALVPTTTYGMMHRTLLTPSLTWRT